MASVYGRRRLLSSQPQTDDHNHNHHNNHNEDHHGNHPHQGHDNQDEGHNTNDKMTSAGASADVAAEAVAMVAQLMAGKTDIRDKLKGERGHLQGAKHTLHAMSISYAACIEARDNPNCTTYAFFRGVLNEDVNIAELDAEAVDSKFKTEVQALQTEFQAALTKPGGLDDLHQKCTADSSDCVSVATFQNEVSSLLAEYTAKLKQLQPSLELAALLQRRQAGASSTQTFMLELLAGKGGSRRRRRRRPPPPLPCPSSGYWFAIRPSSRWDQRNCEVFNDGTRCPYKEWMDECNPQQYGMPPQSKIDECCRAANQQQLLLLQNDSDPVELLNVDILLEEKGKARVRWDCG